MDPEVIQFSLPVQALLFTIAIACVVVCIGSIWMPFDFSKKKPEIISNPFDKTPSTSPSQSDECIEIGSDLLGVTVRAVIDLGNRCKLIVAEGSIIDFTGDAIVNAANTGGLGGGGVDGAVTAAGGSDLQMAREALPVLDGVEGTGKDIFGRGLQTRIREGDAVTTVGGDLHAKWVIHAVGPAYSSESNWKEEDSRLCSAYTAAVREAVEKECKTMAFSLLSAGIFRNGRPLETVLRIGCEAVRDADRGSHLREVYLVGFTSQEVATLIEAAVAMSGGGGSSGGDLEEGTQVMVYGLQGALQHNGKVGVVMTFDASKGRYGVRLEESGTTILVKGDNLKPVDSE